jgi:hypothetical protein
VTSTRLCGTIAQSTIGGGGDDEREKDNLRLNDTK